MVQRTSSGLLMYRFGEKGFEFFLVHPGGPFFEKKDNGVWSIPKGEANEDEDLLAAAKREFFEETGINPVGDFFSLGEIKQKSGKVVHAWAFEGNTPPNYALTSNFFEIEWPRASGAKKSFPEIDKACFFGQKTALKKMNPAQKEFIERLGVQLKVGQKKIGEFK